MKKPIIISLGCRCSVAQFLQDNGLRQKSYPYDWIWTNLKFIYNSLNTNCFAFSEIEKANISHFSNDNKHPHTYIYDNDYTAISVHDADRISKDDFPKIIPDINEKYKRRFDRLINELNKKQNVLLLRQILPTNITSKLDKTIDSVELINSLNTLLKTKFMANITLIIIDKENIIDINELDDSIILWSRL